MNKRLVVTPEKLSVDGFAPYGVAILEPPEPAPKSGNDWDCWFGLGDLSPGKSAIGIVRTRPSSADIEVMEREPKTEFLLPISDSVIQVVALPGDLSNHKQQPQAATVRAFIIQPGQAIIMAPGTWHWAALPAGGEEVLYYFITEPHPPEPGREKSPWVAFENDDVVQLQLPL